MKRFEVGKVYALKEYGYGFARAGDKYIRITKRSDACVCFEKLDKSGKAYNSGCKFKRVKEESGAEVFHIDWAWETYSAEYEVEDWEAVVSAYIEQENARATKETDAREKRLAEKVTEVGAFLTENGVSAAVAEEIVERFSHIPYEVWRRLQV